MQGYSEVPWSPMRDLIFDTMRHARKAPTIHGLFEVDITHLRKLLKQRLHETGAATSLVAYLVYCYAHTLDNHKELAAVRQGRKKLIVFDDIDVTTIVERKGANNEKVPVGFIIRAANRKTLQEIQDELRERQKRPPTDFEEIQTRRSLLKYPRFIRTFIVNRIYRNPHLYKKYFGTAALSSLNIFSGNRLWWGVPVTRAPICLLPSATYTKAVLVEGEWKNREFLTMTLSLDHNISDGMPARRFAQEFINRLEACYGL